MIYCSVCGAANPFGNSVCQRCSAHPLQPLPPAESTQSVGLEAHPTLSIRPADSHDTLETAAPAFSAELPPTKLEPQVALPLASPDGVPASQRGARAVPDSVPDSVQHVAASAPHPMARTAQSHLAPEANELVGFLVSFQPSKEGAFWVLRSGENRVGRSKSGQELQVAIDNVTISSFHALIRAEPEYRTLQIVDAGSANGTYLNGRKLEPHQARELRDGDLVRIGGFDAVVKVVPRVGVAEVVAAQA